MKSPKNQPNNTLTPLSDSLKKIDLTGHPPVDQWQPAHHGEIDILIQADGTWLHEGSPIQRKELVKLFASVLWYENGVHYLKTPAEQMRIRVEDAAFFVPLLDVVDAGTPQQQLLFTSSYADKVIAGTAHRLWVEEDEDGEPLPYLGMRYGMKARLSRNVFVQLGELMVEKPLDATEANAGKGLFVCSQGIDFLLAKLP